jgi:hypothetical protein
MAHEKKKKIPPGKELHLYASILTVLFRSPSLLVLARHFGHLVQLHGFQNAVLLLFCHACEDLIRSSMQDRMPPLAYSGPWPVHGSTKGGGIVSEKYSHPATKCAKKSKYPPALEELCNLCKPVPKLALDNNDFLVLLLCPRCFDNGWVDLQNTQAKKNKITMPKQKTSLCDCSAAQRGDIRMASTASIC